MNMVVVTHPEMGIYLGGCMGLGFWSKLDSAGQSRACVFEGEEQARAHIASWDENNNPDDYEYKLIECADAKFATLAELCKAGLELLTGDMIFNVGEDDEEYQVQ